MKLSPARALTVGVLFSGLLAGAAVASGLADLSNDDAARGIKGALTQGAASAVSKLGVPGGFLNNPKVKIPLPLRSMKLPRVCACSAPARTRMSSKSR